MRKSGKNRTTIKVQVKYRRSESTKVHAYVYKRVITVGIHNVKKMLMLFILHI